MTNVTNESIHVFQASACRNMSDMKCRCCGSALNHLVVDLGLSPLCESLVYADQLMSLKRFIHSEFMFAISAGSFSCMTTLAGSKSSTIPMHTHHPCPVHGLSIVNDTPKLSQTASHLVIVR